jgi:hypothetical protein
MADESKRVPKQPKSKIPKTKQLPGTVQTASKRKQPTLTVNRLEVGSSFDFDGVVQLLVSPPRRCPHKAGYRFVTVVCITESSRTPLLLMGYLFDAARSENKLQHWQFVNNKGRSSRMDIEAFEDVEETLAEAENAQANAADGNCAAVDAECAAINADEGGGCVFVRRADMPKKKKRSKKVKTEEGAEAAGAETAEAEARSIVGKDAPASGAGGDSQ